MDEGWAGDTRKDKGFSLSIAHSISLSSPVSASLSSFLDPFPSLCGVRGVVRPQRARWAMMLNCGQTEEVIQRKDREHSKKNVYVLGTEESAEVTLSRTLKGLSSLLEPTLELKRHQCRANLGSLALMTS